MGISSSARASLYFYNDEADVDAFIAALRDTAALFAGMGSVEAIL